jgi:hypothetical protein
MSTGQPHACGGHGCSPSATHQTTSPTERSGAGLYKGLVASVRRTSVRATPHGFTAPGCASRSAKPSKPSRQGTTAFRHTGTFELSSVGRESSTSATTRRNDCASRRRVTESVSCLARRARSSELSGARPSASSRSQRWRCNRTLNRTRSLGARTRMATCRDLARDATGFIFATSPQLGIRGRCRAALARRSAGPEAVPGPRRLRFARRSGP